MRTLQKLEAKPEPRLKRETSIGSSAMEDSNETKNDVVFLFSDQQLTTDVQENACLVFRGSTG